MANIYAQVYYKLVAAGRKTITDVPADLQTEVSALLAADKQA